MTEPSDPTTKPPVRLPTPGDLHSTMNSCRTRAKFPQGQSFQVYIVVEMSKDKMRQTSLYTVTETRLISCS